MSYFSAAFAGYFPNGLPSWVVPAGATTIIAFVTVAHCFGQSASGRFQVAITSVKFRVVAQPRCGWIAVWHWRLGAPFRRALAVRRPVARPGDWPHLCELRLLRVNAAAYLAGEIRDPARLLPRTLLTGTLTVTALYILVNFAYVFALNRRP